MLAVDGKVVSGSNLKWFQGWRRCRHRRHWQPMRKPEFEVPNPLSLFMGERQAAGSRGPRRLRGTVRPNHGQRPHPPDFDPLRGAGLVRAERIARAEGVLAEVGLHGVARTYPWQLSGEMQQRVAIARALVSRPDVLLLDEPFASVDALTRAELQDLLLRVHGGIEHGRVTIVHVTHDIDEAVYLADRVLVLGAAPGRVVGSIEVGIARPRAQTTTRSSPQFLAVRNQIHDVIAAKEATP